MNKKKIIALASTGLVAAMVLGTAGMAYGAETTGPLFGSGARMGQAIRDAGARLVDIVADLTGLSVEEVQAQRAEGNSAAEIAEANGVSTETVVDEALAARKTILDAKVADGTITQEQADAAYAQMSQRVTERVSAEESGRPSWAGGGSASGRGMGGGQGACGGTCVVTQ
ncbi:MAG: hypothetical protein WBJ62_00270 [Coriobacteriia bacterium]